MSPAQFSTLPFLLLSQCKKLSNNGASLGFADGSCVRSDDETLRSSDIQWVRYPHGIGATVTVKFLKGHRDPHRRENVLPASRTIALVSTAGKSYFLDPSIFLFALAYERGLFRQPLQELLDGDEAYLEMTPEGSNQPVFLGVDRSGKTTNQAMKFQALNPKLQDMCLLAGLSKRNTMYSFRRTAIQEPLRHHGKAEAAMLANHTPGNTRALRRYTERDREEVDLTAMRLGKQGMARDAAAAIWRQSNSIVHYSSSESLKERLLARVQMAAEQDPEWEQLDGALEATIIKIIERFSVDRSNRFYGPTAYVQYKSLFGEKGATDLLDELDERLTARKYGRASIRRRVRRQELKSIEEEISQSLKLLSNAPNC